MFDLYNVSSRAGARTRAECPFCPFGEVCGSGGGGDILEAGAGW